MHLKTDKLSSELVDRVLIKLGFSEPPSVDFTGLTRLYRRWCCKVPFDNIRKRIHLAANDSRPLPGHDDTEFFHGWLRFGVGGTCWAGNAALHALLDALGFSCNRGTATMLTNSRQAAPNHGTVVVQCEEKQFLVDASMLHNSPLLLTPNQPSSIDHMAWGLTCSPHEQHWTIRWRPLHMVDGCKCRIEGFSVTRDAFRQLNEASRNRSPFNDSLYIRLNGQESVMGISGGMTVYFSPTGKIIKKPLSHENRLKFLIERMGLSEEIVSQIPPDLEF